MSKNPNYQLPISTVIFAFSAAVGVLLAAVIIGLNSNAEKTAKQASSPHITQAGEWLIVVSVLPVNSEHEAFVSDLGVAMSDGTITDEENAKLYANYKALTNKKGS